VIAEVLMHQLSKCFVTQRWVVHSKQSRDKHPELTKNFANRAAL
jgi:hypothetical protein